MSRRIFAISPDEYREHCDRIRAPHPAVQRFLAVARDFARLFIQHRGVRNTRRAIRFCVCRGVTSHLFRGFACRGSSQQDRRCGSRKTGETGKIRTRVTTHSEDRSQTPTMARIPLPESLFLSLSLFFLSNLRFKF